MNRAAHNYYTMQVVARRCTDEGLTPMSYVDRFLNCSRVGSHGTSFGRDIPYNFLPVG